MADAGMPVVTFAVVAYNQQEFIAEAVESAMAQDYPELEILISDDASTDSTFTRIEDLVRSYRGRHRLRIHRNPVNLGLIAHVNQVFEMATGEMIVIAAGDDVSLLGRTRALAARYFGATRPGLVHSSVMRIDLQGRELGVWRPPLVSRSMDLFDIAVSSALYIGASGAWNPQLHRQFGPMRAAGGYEDLILGFRAALQGGIVYVDEPLVRYRIGSGITRRQYSANLLADFVRAETRHVDLSLTTLDQRLADLGRVNVPQADRIAHVIQRERARQALRRGLLMAPRTTWREASLDDRLRLAALVMHEANRALKFAAEAWLSMRAATRS